MIATLLGLVICYALVVFIGWPIAVLGRRLVGGYWSVAYAGCAAAIPVLLTFGETPNWWAAGFAALMWFHEAECEASKP